ncbi:hypothetical protein B0H19DRAFT_1055521 [Mycena capillaripes]|nr:hypothetical protein B0H19DRAFT_1055521 [Mycena capillaripes]
MRFSLVLLVTSLAGLTSAQKCDNNKGTCKNTSKCSKPGYYPVTGLCPGPKDYQCCIPSGSSCDSNKGICKYTSECLGPEYYPVTGLCPGPKDYQCCIPSGCVKCDAAEERDLDARALEGRRPCC